MPLTRPLLAIVWIGLASDSMLVAEELPPPKELLDLSLEPPLINTHPGPQYQDDVRMEAQIVTPARF